jgi:hypothetical protein
MPHQIESPQWAMHVIVFHGPTFGHRIRLETQRQGCAPVASSLGTWKGMGIPESLLELATARVADTLHLHLETRYGIAQELPFPPSGSGGTAWTRATFGWLSSFLGPHKQQRKGQSSDRSTECPPHNCPPCSRIH